MSELIFGPSVDPLFIGKGNECMQPRLDGGYELTPRRKAGKFVIRETVKINTGYEQPSLFDEEITDPEEPTLF
jgi:hypothetical protein